MSFKGYIKMVYGIPYTYKNIKLLPTLLFCINPLLFCLERKFDMSYKNKRKKMILSKIIMADFANCVLKKFFLSNKTLIFSMVVMGVIRQPLE